jgi:hypothetical protein
MMDYNQYLLPYKWWENCQDLSQPSILKVVPTKTVGSTSVYKKAHSIYGDL